MASSPDSESSGYSLKRVWAAKDSALGSGSLSESFQSIQRSACFRQAMLSGALVAALLAAHRLKEAGTRLRATNDAVLGFLGVFQLQWYLCRKDEVERREATRRFYANQMALQGGGGGHGGTTPASSSAGGGVGGGPSVGGDVVDALGRMVAYDDLPTVEEGSQTSFTMR